MKVTIEIKDGGTAAADVLAVLNGLALAYAGLEDFRIETLGYRGITITNEPEDE